MKMEHTYGWAHYSQTHGRMIRFVPPTEDTERRMLIFAGIGVDATYELHELKG